MEVTCALCGGPTTGEAFCHGCGHHVCESCDDGSSMLMGVHDLADHGGPAPAPPPPRRRRPRRKRPAPTKPLRRVVKATRMRGLGSVICNTFRARWWELELECGHVVERQRRFRDPPGYSAQGFARMHHPPPDKPEYEKPHPKRCRCRFCPDIGSAGA